MDIAAIANGVGIVTGIFSIGGAIERIIVFIRRRTRAPGVSGQQTTADGAPGAATGRPFAYPVLFGLSLFALALALVVSFVVYPALVSAEHSVLDLVQQAQSGNTVDPGVFLQTAQHFFGVFVALMAISLVGGLVGSTIGGFAIIRSAQLRRWGWTVGMLLLVVLSTASSITFVVLAVNDGIFNTFGGQLYKQYTQTGVSSGVFAIAFPYAAIIFGLWGPTTARASAAPPSNITAPVTVAAPVR